MQYLWFPIILFLCCDSPLHIWFTVLGLLIAHVLLSVNFSAVSGFHCIALCRIELMNRHCLNLIYCGIFFFLYQLLLTVMQDTVVLAGIYGLSELVEHRFKYLLPFNVSTQQSSDSLMRMLFCLSILQLLMFIFPIHLVLLLL